LAIPEIQANSGSAMRAAMTSAVARFVPGARRRVRAAQFIGLGIASLVPAALWSALIAGFAALIGSPLTTRSITLIGAAIAFFLALICAPVILRE
jgi:hypothetical protein